MKTAGNRGAKGRATVLHSRIVRARGACERCGESNPFRLQCAHIISRRYAHTRTDEDNALCLCGACHIYFTNHPVEFGMWVLEHVGESKYRALYAKAGERRKVDWDAEVERLSAILKQIEAA